MIGSGAFAGCCCCGAVSPEGGVYEPLPGSGEYRCRDQKGCRRRLAYAGDPIGPPVPAAPPSAGAGGTVTCDYCRGVVMVEAAFAPVPGGAYYRCRDTQACQVRAAGQFLVAHRDDYPEVAVTTQAGMRAASAQASAEVPAGGERHPSARAAAEADAAWQLAAMTRR